MERDTGKSILRIERISAVRASVEVSRSVETVRPKDRHIWSWGGGCIDATGERGKVIPSGLRQQEVEASRGKVFYNRKGMSGY